MGTVAVCASGDGLTEFLVEVVVVELGLCWLALGQLLFLWWC